MKRINGKRTQKWQEWVLNRLVETRFVKNKKEVKGPYTTANFVMWSLNKIFGPSNWSFQILAGPTLTAYSDAMAYAQATVRLTVKFTNGQEVVHEEVGVWPLRAKKAGGTLDKTPPEMYELALKAAVTDGLKACTDHFANCMRPMADEELEAFLRQRQAEESLEEKKLSAVGEDPEKSAEDLFGEEAEAEAKEDKPEMEVALSQFGQAERAEAEKAPKQQQLPTPEKFVFGQVAESSAPTKMNDLYIRAKSELGFKSTQDAATLLADWLDENHGTTSIGGYATDEQSVATLWEVLKAVAKA